MSLKIKEYWNERAQAHTLSPSATTDDVYLRELEIRTLTQTLEALGLPQDCHFLDIGCGNGYSTMKLAGAFPRFSFTGMDYSESMIENAKKQHAVSSDANIEFVLGDITHPPSCMNARHFDLSLTDRCLINMETVEEQAQAIREIARLTKSGGYYIAIENFVEGHERMNHARLQIGLPPIPVRWHNLYFQEPVFLELIHPYFRHIRFTHFASSYYFATRIVYAKMCQLRGESPDYNHDIHKLAVALPFFENLSPIRMAVMQRL
ncbi:MAG: class I SAM-dependent methyltransferase [Candidatus Omnitrophica bacterium]|nr:class I SAM-dependent methyltransferase [Candidatus Omnitrophota bacterium]